MAEARLGVGCPCGKGLKVNVPQPDLASLNLVLQELYIALQRGTQL